MPDTTRIIPSSIIGHFQESAVKNNHQLRIETIKKNKNNAIRDAAEKLFTLKEYESITMDDISSAAKVSKATLYKHFKTKDDLYLATINSIFEHFDQTQQHTNASTLETYLLHHIDFCLSKKCIDLIRHCASQIIRFPDLSTFLWSNDRPIYEKISDFIVAHPTNSSKNKESARDMSQMLLSLIYARIVFPVWYGHQPPLSSDDVKLNVRNLLTLLNVGHKEIMHEDLLLDHKNEQNSDTKRAVFF